MLQYTRPVRNLGPDQEGTVLVDCFARPSFTDPDNNELLITTEFAADNYLTLNPGSHWGMMIRANPHTVPGDASTYKAHGIIMGTIGNNGANDAIGDFRMGMESWNTTSQTVEFLKPGAWSPVLRETWLYRLTVSSKIFCGQQYRRYILQQERAGKGSFETLIDTGDVYDNNWVLPRDSDTVIFFDTSAPSTAVNADGTKKVSSVRFMNFKASWITPVGLAPDLTWLNPVK